MNLTPRFFIIATQVLALAQTANASDISAQENWYNIGQEALSTIHWDWEYMFLEWKIEFHPGQPGLLGLCSQYDKTIDVWVRKKHSKKIVASIIVHELAHAFDYQYMSWTQRKSWLVLRNLPQNTRWYPPINVFNDYGHGAGDFAECVSWTLQGPIKKFRSKLGPPPNKEQQAVIKKWLTKY